jgi:hypothetical protein
MSQGNGADGYYHYPVTPTITYVIRDNDNALFVPGCASRLRYDVFVISGQQPTVRKFTYCRFLSSFDSYIDCCYAIDDMTERAEALQAARIAEEK